VLHDQGDRLGVEADPHQTDDVFVLEVAHQLSLLEQLCKKQKAEFTCVRPSHLILELQIP